jgi:hypothetical protein
MKRSEGVAAVGDDKDRAAEAARRAEQAADRAEKAAERILEHGTIEKKYSDTRDLDRGEQGDGPGPTD